MLNSDIPPRRARVYQNQIKSLNARIEDLETERDYYRSMIFDMNIPANIKDWMREYDTPIWELFYCDEHKQWYVELDSLFPYHHENNCCSECMR